MCDTFERIITIIDEWESGGDKFRLVNLGAGPDRLQILDNGKWKEESNCFKWGVLTNRIKMLKNSITKS